MNTNKLKQYLTAKGLNQAQFAAIARVNPVDISRLITGERPASVRVAKAVEAATGGEITRHDLRPDIYGDARVKEPS